MRGYPKRVATVQDFENLLADNELKSQALADLAAIYSADDATVERVVSGSEETGDLVTETIDNPMPLWKQKSFASREAVRELIEANGGKV